MKKPLLEWLIGEVLSPRAEYGPSPSTRPDSAAPPPPPPPPPPPHKAGDGLSDLGPVLAAGPSEAGHAVRQAEGQVPLEWNEGDVILDLYEVRKVHTSGGMGLVYRVFHRGWNMELAVKTPRPQFFATEAHKATFIRECETWINLGLHPNIVSCHYVRQLGGIPRVFAEYVPGGSLRDWIDSGRLYEGSPDEALGRILDVATQFAWGLQSAHEQGLIHQDVKPANVMMTLDGTAKVTDFGLAKAHQDLLGGGGGGDRLVSSGGMTPAYCSPEQAARSGLNLQTDIWSWAVSVLEMFNGEVTWMAGQIADEALRGYLGAGCDNPAIPPMPDAVAELLGWCLNKEPSQRPAHMLQVADRLKEVIRQHTGRPYARPEPGKAELLADGMNNRAVSLLDLGYAPQAVELLGRALRSDPHHLEATYNRGLLAWRGGQISDQELIKQLEEVRSTHADDWRDEYLLGLIHLERGDGQAAREMLAEAARQAPNDAGVRSALKAAEEEAAGGSRILQSLECPPGQSGAVALSGDGQRLLLGREDGTTFSCDVAGATHRVIGGQADGGVMALDSHPSTDEVLITRADGLVQCSADGSGPARTVPATGRLTTACFTPTYGRVLAANEQGQAMLINLTTGQPERITQLAVCREDPTNPFAKNTARINCLRHSHDEDWAVAGLADFTVRVFYPETCSPGNELQGHTTPVLSVAISRDKRWILSGARSVPYKRAAYGIDGRTLRLWDRISGQCVRVFDHKLAVLGAYLGDDGQWGLTLSEDGLCRLWSVRTGRCVRTFGRPVERSGALAVTPDGQHAAVLCDDIADVWKVGGLSPRRAAVAAALPHDVGELNRHAAQLDEALSSGQRLMDEGRPGDVLDVVGQARALKGYERHPGLIKLWRRAGRYARRSGLRGGWLTRTYDTGATVSAVGLDPTGTIGISGATAFMDAYNAVSVWDLATGERRRIWSGHTKPITRIATSIDGQWIISTSRDGTARGWRQGRCDGIARHTKPVLVADMHPNLHVMTGGEFPQVRLWALPGMTYPMQFALPDEADRCGALACGPDGRWAVVAIGSGLYVLDISSKRWHGPVATGLSTVTDLSVNPLGRVLAAGEDGACEAWDLGPARKVGGFDGHGDAITSAVLTADGLWAITGSRDGTVRLWDVTGGQCLRTFEGHSGPVLAVALDVRERRVLSGGEDKTLRLWELDWEYTFDGFADQCDAVADAIIEDFLVLHCRRAGGGMDITGRPVYRPDEIKYLLKQMQRCGLGHIHPETVKQRVDALAGSWSKPPACRAMRS